MNLYELCVSLSTTNKDKGLKMHLFIDNSILDANTAILPPSAVWDRPKPDYASTFRQLRPHLSLIHYHIARQLYRLLPNSAQYTENKF